jgi:hypothetical protein
MKLLYLFLFLLISFSSFSQKLTTKDGRTLYKAKTLILEFGEPSIRHGKTSKNQAIKINEEKGMLKSNYKYYEIDTNIHIGRFMGNRGNRILYNNELLAVSNTKTFYNKKGLKTKEVKYSIDNNILSTKTFEYDNKQNLISEEKVSNKNRDSKKFIFNDENDLVQDLSYNNEQLVSNFLIDYDYTNRIVTSYCNDIINNQSRKTVNYFNEKLEKTKVVFYDWHGNLRSYNEYTYNENGDKVKVYFNNVSKNAEFTTTFVYNDKQLIRKETRDKTGTITSEHDYLLDKNRKKNSNFKTIEDIQIDSKNYKKTMQYAIDGKLIYNLVQEFEYH